MITKLPSNPFDILKSFYRKMYLKINEIIDELTIIVNSPGNQGVYLVEEAELNEFFTESSITVGYEYIFADFYFDIEQSPNLNRFDFPYLKFQGGDGELGFSWETINQESLTLNFPELTQAEDLEVENSTEDTDAILFFNAPKLVEADLYFENFYNTSFIAPPLMTNGCIRLSSYPLLTFVDISNITSLNFIEDSSNSRTFQVSNSPLFSNINISNSITVVGGIPQVNCSNCGLPATEINKIMTAFDNGGGTNGSMNFTGGTNATLDATGLILKASLEGKGWTVNNN